MRGKGKPFKKGAKSGPGKFPVDEVTRIRESLSRGDFQEALRRLKLLTIAVLEQIAADRTRYPSELVIVANWLVDATHERESRDSLIDRIHGKVTVKSEVEHKHQGQLDHALRAIPRDVLTKLARESNE